MDKKSIIQWNCRGLKANYNEVLILRAIPDKNQKILNGAGHSWSQIFMKLSEHVKVVTLSKYSTLFYFPTCTVAMATEHKDFSLQISKMTT